MQRLAHGVRDCRLKRSAMLLTNPRNIVVGRFLSRVLKVHLKPGTKVEVTVEAAPEATISLTKLAPQSHIDPHPKM